MEEPTTKKLFIHIYMEETLNFLFEKDNSFHPLINEIVNKYERKRTEKEKIPYFVNVKKYNNEKTT